MGEVLPLRGDLAAPCGGGRARAPRNPALGRAEAKWEVEGRGLGLDVVMGW